MVVQIHLLVLYKCINAFYYFSFSFVGCICSISICYEKSLTILWGHVSTNHVDRILGNFDPPPSPYVDTLTK